MTSYIYEIDRAARENPADLDDIFDGSRMDNILAALRRGSRVALIGSDDRFRERLNRRAIDEGTPTTHLLGEAESNQLLTIELRSKTIGMLMIQSSPAEFFFI